MSLLVGALVLTLAAMTQPSAAQVIKVRILVEKGSVWAGAGDKVGRQITEARRIWFANVGVRLSIQAPSEIAGTPDTDISAADVATYARTHGAKADDIVVVFRNKSVGVSRAYADATLVAGDAPVVIVGRQVFDRPGTHRDLAHELGHVLLRSAEHSNGQSDLMNITWAPDNGEFVSDAQKEKAKAYPKK